MDIRQMIYHVYPWWIYVVYPCIYHVYPLRWIYMVYSCIYHVYPMYIGQDGIYMGHTWDIPCIYRKSVFQMYDSLTL